MRRTNSPLGCTRDASGTNTGTVAGSFAACWPPLLCVLAPARTCRLGLDNGARLTVPQAAAGKRVRNGARSGHGVDVASEQSKHIARREEIMRAKGERAEGGFHGNRFVGPATVAGPRTTADLANDAGMSERTWRGRNRVGSSIKPATAEVLS